MAWDVLSRVAKMAWDVLSGVTKTAWDVLSGVANRCGMFCPGWQKMAWDVLSRDVLSYIRRKFVYDNTTFNFELGPISVLLACHRAFKSALLACCHTQ